MSGQNIYNLLKNIVCQLIEAKCFPILSPDTCIVLNINWHFYCSIFGILNSLDTGDSIMMTD